MSAAVLVFSFLYQLSPPIHSTNDKKTSVNTTLVSIESLSKRPLTIVPKKEVSVVFFVLS